MPRGVYNHPQHTEEWNRNIGKSLTGHPTSEETARKIIFSRKNNGEPWHTKETRRKISKTLTGHITTEETKKKQREANLGERSPSWQGGISNLPYPFDFNEELKELIRKRDNNTCQLCGKTKVQAGQNLCVHHIDYIKENLDPKNLLTLCRKCNIKVNSKRKSWIEFFRLKLKVA